ncbi:MAG: YHYH domain-containing protein [Acutalibacteraceae bacterium]|nr:YHYH domain-containing protein [Acutalibacteraceae bacterium]
MKKYISILMVLCSLTWIIAFAHPGRTDSNGGHWVRTEGWGYEVGTYHYHNNGYSENAYTPPAITPQPPTSESPPVASEAETKGFDVEEAIRKAKERKKAEEKNKEETSLAIIEFTPHYNYSDARKVYEQNHNPDKSGWDDFWLLLCLYAFIIVFGGFVIWLRQKPIIDVPPKKDKLPNKLNVIDEYQMAQAIKEDNNKLFEALDKKQQALIPEGTAIDENGLPYLVNRQYGYGRLYNAFVTKSGNHYHRSRCPEILGRKKKCIHRYDAIKSYQPCIRCKPLCHVDDWYLEYIEIEKTKNNIRQK